LGEKKIENNPNHSNPPISYYRRAGLFGNVTTKIKLPTQRITDREELQKKYLTTAKKKTKNKKRTPWGEGTV
jgi:hypothetical protein